MRPSDETPRRFTVIPMILLALASACSDDNVKASALSVTSASTSATASGVVANPSTTTPGPTSTQTSTNTVANPSQTATTTTSGSAVASTSPTPSSTGPGPTPTTTATTTATTTTTSQPTATAVVTAEPIPTEPLPQPTAGTADAVAADIDSLFQGKTRFVAKFHQKHKQKVAGIEREQDGTVYVERPNKISFHYDPPNQNRIVSDGSTLRVYVADDQQMFESPVKNTEYPGAFSFIMGGGLRRSFEFTFHDKAKFDAGYVLVGKPKTPNPQYESVLFYIDKDKLTGQDPNAVAGVLILDAQANKNRFELHDASFPDTIDANEFKFEPPAGTNITKS
ncbi:MAG: outer membrane lipoprotein carrier protein LolA [Polyangiaceae bacterium]